MQLISHYVFKNIALTTMVTSLVLTMIIWLTQSLVLFDIIINGGAPMRLFGLMLLLIVPKFFEIILPISLGLSILYTLNKFSSDSELIVMQNSGLGPMQLSAKTLTFVMVIAGIMLFLSGWVTPMAGREMERLRNLVKSEYSIGLLRPGIFTTLGDKATIYIAERTDLTDLRGVFIHLKEQNGLPSTITAQHGGMAMRDGKPYVVVYDGLRQQFNPKTNAFETLRFDRYSLDLSTLASPGMVGESVDPDERTLSNLWRFTGKVTEPKEKQQAIVELHTRLARPFLTVAFAMIALVPFITGQFNRRGQMKRIVGIIIGLFFLQASHLGSIYLSRVNIAGLGLLYGIPIVIILIGSFMMASDRSKEILGMPLNWLRRTKMGLI